MSHLPFAALAWSNTLCCQRDELRSYSMVSAIARPHHCLFWLHACQVLFDHNVHQLVQVRQETPFSLHNTLILVTHTKFGAPIVRVPGTDTLTC